MAPNQDFAGQAALVTGAASGIGEHVALMLAQRGAKVCLVDLNAAALGKALQKLQAAAPGADFFTQPTDVADVRAANAAVEAAVRRWGRLDVLCQCAGITGKTNVMTQDVDPDNFDLVLRVNLRGIFCMCRAALPTMIRQKYGRIVNIASIAGKEGNAGMLAYSSSKAAVIALTKVGSARNQ